MQTPTTPGGASLAQLDLMIRAAEQDNLQRAMSPGPGALMAARVRELEDEVEYLRHELTVKQEGRLRQYRTEMEAQSREIVAENQALKMEAADLRQQLQAVEKTVAHLRRNRDRAKGGAKSASGAGLSRAANKDVVDKSELVAAKKWHTKEVRVVEGGAGLCVCVCVCTVLFYYSCAWSRGPSGL
jgi:regulator of replication initiation timing